MDTKKIFKHIPWVILGIIGAFCLAVVALRRGEHVSALWIVVASVSVYLVEIKNIILSAEGHGLIYFKRRFHPVMLEMEAAI